jgi:hypothetical protein
VPYGLALELTCGQTPPHNRLSHGTDLFSGFLETLCVTNVSQLGSNATDETIFLLRHTVTRLTNQNNILRNTATQPLKYVPRIHT